MIKNYFKVAIRSLLKQKGLTLINVLGLSIGFGCFILFLSYAVHEFNFDTFHDRGDDIYRVYRWTEDLDGEGPEGDPHLPMPLGPSMAADFPDIEEVVRWKSAWVEQFFRIGDRTGNVEVSHVDPSIFDVFTFPLKYGDPGTALSDPRNVVLTEETALRLFNETNPIGKTVEIKFGDSMEPFTVSGVAENIPSYSSMNFQMLGSFEFFASTANGQKRANNWNNSFLNVFLRLREGSGLADNHEALLRFREKHYPGQESELRESGYWTKEGPPVTYRLQPIEEMHTDTSIWSGSVPAIDPKNIWTLLLIALGVLLIAIINFTTLSIGRSSDRSKEVGIRKVIGGTRSQVAMQFLTESILTGFIALAIGLGISQAALPYFNKMTGRELELSFTQFPQFSVFLVGVTIVTGLLAGSYPALMLSGFRPIEVFRKNLTMGGSNWFTKSLVTTQFALSICLIIATLIAVQQLEYLRSENPGFDKENVVVVDANNATGNDAYTVFKNALSSTPAIVGVAASELGLGSGAGWSRAGFDYRGENKQVYEYFVDDDYIEVMGMNLLRGRDFDAERQDGPNRSVIVNESMIKDFGWTIDNVVGQELSGYFDEGDAPKVIGVVEDFNFRALREEVLPQMFHQYEDYAPFRYFVRIQPGDPEIAINEIEDAWSSAAPSYPLQYSFLDEDLNRFYRSEERFSSIISWAGGMSIFLSCLGLLGLVGLAAVNRAKEIGIRKVLGASVPSIVGLLSRDFLILVTIALVVASPITWYLMNGWLQDFAYRVDIQWWVFALAGLMAIIVALLTISIHSVRSALANPADSLRSE